MELMDFRSKWVLVTGASAGLGWEMCKVLASDHGANVIAVARRRDRLDALKHDIESSTNSSVLPIAADLSKLGDVDRVFREATADRAVYAAVLNAGITHFGEYHELAWEDFQTMLATNVTGVVRLATQLLPYLEQRAERGGVLIVSSMAGLTPVPYQTAYSATKAFLVNFGCGLWHEVRHKNISVTTFVPGGIQTDMTAGIRFRALGGWLMPVDECAAEAIDCFRRRRYLHVPGIAMRFGATIARFMPRQFLTERVAMTYRKALETAKHR